MKINKEIILKYQGNYNINLKNLLILGIATSLDAFAVGLSFAFLKVSMLISLTLIGLVTFLMCFIGPYLGNYFGSKISNKPQVVGGIILIIIGFKILIF